jgi:hypothetical protein
MVHRFSYHLHVCNSVLTAFDCFFFMLIFGISEHRARVSVFRVLSGMGLSGTLTGDIGNFPELQTLWVFSMFSCPLLVQLSCLKIQ